MLVILILAIAAASIGIGLTIGFGGLMVEVSDKRRKANGCVCKDGQSRDIALIICSFHKEIA